MSGAQSEWGLRPGEIVLGRYEARDPLGAGGMGEVWRARDRTLGRDVAVKLLHTHVANARGAVERFEREAQVLARLRHPSVVQVFDFGRDEKDRLCLVMEFVGGSPADVLLHFDGPFAPTRAARLCAQVCEVLAEAHAAGIVHRDLKPSNLLVTGTGDTERVKVLDFGIALVEDASAPKLTQEGRVVGTPEYMSPEQCRGLALDGRSDLYSLGCVLYELLGGEPPFGSGAHADLMSYHLYRAPRAPSRAHPALGIPEWLDRACLKALQKRADDRFPDASAMREALERPDAGKAPGRVTRDERRGGVTAPAVFKAPATGSDATADGPLVRSRVGVLEAGIAPAGAAAQAALAAHGFDATWLDADADPTGLEAIVLVGDDGRDALSAASLLLMLPAAPPLVLCGPEDDVELMTLAIGAGIFDYVPLPLDAAELSRKVSRAVSRRR